MKRINFNFDSKTYEAMESFRLSHKDKFPTKTALITNLVNNAENILLKGDSNKEITDLNFKLLLKEQELSKLKEELNSVRGEGSDSSGYNNMVINELKELRADIKKISIQNLYASKPKKEVSVSNPTQSSGNDFIKVLEDIKTLAMQSLKSTTIRNEKFDFGEYENYLSRLEIDSILVGFGSDTDEKLKEQIGFIKFILYANMNKTYATELLDMERFNESGLGQIYNKGKGTD